MTLQYNTTTGKFEERKQQTRRKKRHYSAGESASFLGWDTPLVSADAAIYSNLNLMKARCRDLARNNDYVRHALRLFQSNVIGPDGFRLQSCLRSGDKADKAFNKNLERHWRNAGKKKNDPTVDGRMSRVEMAKLWLRTLLVDGEVIRVYHPAHSNKYKFSIQFVDSARLDWQMNQQLPNGNEVRMGVEIDSYGKPVSYYFLNQDSTDNMWGYRPTSKTHTRIPANRVRHDFIIEEVGQTRGVSLLASPAVRAHMLQRFEEAVVVGARVAASKVGFYTSTDETPGYVAGDDDDEVAVSQNLDPGTFEMLPRGVSLESFDPAYPPARFEEFGKKLLKGLASGMGSEYVTMANDLEGVNYSSIRAGQLEQREVYKGLQLFYRERVEEPDFETWCSMQQFNPDITINTKKLEKVVMDESYKFLGRGWKWVDPLKEVNAHEKAISLNLTSPRRIVAETTNEDFDDLLEEIAEDRERMAELGLLPIVASEPDELEDEEEEE